MVPANGAPPSNYAIGIEGSLEPYSHSFRRFSDWFLESENYENEQRVRRKDLAFSLPALEAVRQSVRLVLGVDEIEFRRMANQLVVVRKGKAFSYGQLSEGEQGLLLLIGDIARRLAQLLETAENPLLAEATILIDELDLHLHPAWQRTVLHHLLEIFPNCQFIVATHSPQVLSTVPRDASIVLLQDFEPHVLAPAEWRDSNSILSAVFGVPARPPEWTKRLNAVGHLIDEEKYAEAKADLRKLEEELSNADPDVVYYPSLIDFEERGRVADPEGP